MFEIKTVSIIGANGTMGRNIAAIFASFGNANVYLISRTKEKSQFAKDIAYKSVRAESVREHMLVSDYSEMDACIEKSDLIFEACAENINVKYNVHRMVSEALNNLPEKLAVTKIICSGTSGLSIKGIAECYAPLMRKNVVGMHFFNPPYQMILCELSATEYTDVNLYHFLKEYTEKRLLRTTVEVKDTPAFLGNRIGFQFINEAMRLAEQYKYNGGIDYIDAIFGSFTGRNMAPLVTANFVGLDVHKAIIDNLWENTNDFAHDSFILPDYVEKLIQKGKLGRKTGCGLYKTVIYDSGVKIHQVYDIENDIYREKIRYVFPFSEEMIEYLKQGNYDSAFAVLKKNRSQEALICLEGLLKYILYALKAAELVSYNVHAADDVMATGFNWCPPMALAEGLGGKEIVLDLCMDHISDNWISKDEMTRLISKIENSKYDYRRFIRAKS